MKLLIGFKPDFYSGAGVFERLGECDFVRYDRQYLENKLCDYDVLVPHLFENIDSQLISKARRLKIVATPTTGTDHIGVETLHKNGIKLITLNEVPEFINEISSTAELSWLLIMACVRKFPQVLNRVKIEKSWVNTDLRGRELSGKTIGIIGYGRLGKMVARYAQAFNMRVLINDNDSRIIVPDNIERVALGDLFQRSDIISLHVKLNNTSRKLINLEAISLMKDGVIIVNTARGEVIDSEAAIAGLDSGKIGALGIDVCCHEYQSARLPEDPLVTRMLRDDRIMVTPHIGGSTYDAHAKVFGKIAELIALYLESVGEAPKKG
ncbi:MAG: hypothetical protein HQM16_07860 [Deltaproteobacteria bacterium]|nr:hypothetical protein [Deltaproteobacteria bacterium]